jgi:hypothetical protein
MANTNPCPVDCANNEDGWCCLHYSRCAFVHRYCERDEIPPVAVRKRWHTQDYMDAKANRKYADEAPDVRTQDPTVDDGYDKYDDI